MIIQSDTAPKIDGLITRYGRELPSLAERLKKDVAGDVAISKPIFSFFENVRKCHIMRQDLLFVVSCVISIRF